MMSTAAGQPLEIPSRRSGTFRNPLPTKMRMRPLRAIHSFPIATTVIRICLIIWGEKAHRKENSFKGWLRGDLSGIGGEERLEPWGLWHFTIACDWLRCGTG